MVQGNLRIGFSSFVLDGGKSGIATYVRHLLRHLQKLDFENHYDVFLAKRDQVLVPFSNPHFKGLFYPDFIAKPILNVAWHQFYLPFLSYRKGYDLIHIPTIRRIPYIKSSKVVATIHDLAPFIIPKKYDPLRQFYHQHILRKCVHRCDHVITVSQSTKSDIIRFLDYPESRISVIYSGINSIDYHPIPKEEAQEYISTRFGITDPFFIYVSRLEHPGKNHLNLIKAFELFKAKYQTSHQLILVGADWSGADIIKYTVKNSPAKHAIKLMGFLPISDIVNLYSATYLMIFPSLYEGFGFPILEASACGAQVICSNSSSMKEIANDYIQTFDPFQPEDILKSIEKATEHPLEESEKTRLQQYVQTFTWDRTAQQVLDIYKKVMNF